MTVHLPYPLRPEVYRIFFWYFPAEKRGQRACAIQFLLPAQASIKRVRKEVHVSIVDEKTTPGAIRHAPLFYPAIGRSGRPGILS